MAAIDNSAGFVFEYRESGGPATIIDQTSADVALVKGTLTNLESGQLDLAVTDDSALVGAVQETKSGMTAGTTKIEVIVDMDAVYSVYDANARVMGDTLDIAAGARSVGASSNIDLIVVADSSATERTHVKIAIGEGFKN
jgi:hypothetical protein